MHPPGPGGGQRGAGLPPGRAPAATRRANGSALPLPGYDILSCSAGCAAATCDRRVQLRDRRVPSAVACRLQYPAA